MTAPLPSDRCTETTVLTGPEGEKQTVECVHPAKHEGQCAGYFMNVGEIDGYQWWGVNEAPFDDF